MINHLFLEMTRKFEKCSSQFPKAQWCLQIASFIQNNSPNHKDSSFMIINETEKQQIFTVQRLNQLFYLLFYFKKWQKQLINYQNSGRLIFCQLIIRLIVAAVVVTWHTSAVYRYIAIYPCLVMFVVITTSFSLNLSVVFSLLCISE